MSWLFFIFYFKLLTMLQDGTGFHRPFRLPPEDQEGEIEEGSRDCCRDGQDKHACNSEINCLLMPLLYACLYFCLFLLTA